MAKREHHVMVALNDSELAIVDEHRGAAARAAYLRRLLHGPPQEQDVASRAEALGILTRLAREGKQQAACALARELREGGEVDVMSWILDAR